MINSVQTSLIHNIYTKHYNISIEINNFINFTKLLIHQFSSFKNKYKYNMEIFQLLFNKSIQDVIINILPIAMEALMFKECNVKNLRYTIQTEFTHIFNLKSFSEIYIFFDIGCDKKLLSNSDTLSTKDLILLNFWKQNAIKLLNMALNSVNNYHYRFFENDKIQYKSFYKTFLNSVNYLNNIQLI